MSLVFSQLILNSFHWAVLYRIAPFGYFCENRPFGFSKPDFVENHRVVSVFAVFKSYLLHDSAVPSILSGQVTNRILNYLGEAT